MMTLKPAQAFEQIAWAMKTKSHLMVTERWQAQEVNATMCEYLHYQFRLALTGIGTHIEGWQKAIDANYPWAEDHFKERVCGWPLNPGVEWQNWPWANKADESRQFNGQFNHNYMERFWPRFANDIHTESIELCESVIIDADITPMTGIRGEYGDLGEMIQHLAEEPGTRQAYLPIWFPEDTSYANKGRKPCTLGYHFILRNGRLDVTYHIRSCDYYRHFDDDVYMAVRLGIFVLQSCRLINPNVWNHVQLGELVMNITSLHMFLSDYQLMFKQQHPEKK